MPKSRRSGGPKTPAGKQAIAGNAVRTGAYTAQVVLPGEDPAMRMAFSQAEQPEGGYPPYTLALVRRTAPTLHEFLEVQAIRFRQLSVSFLIEPHWLSGDGQQGLIRGPQIRQVLVYSPVTGVSRTSSTTTLPLPSVFPACVQ